MGKVQAPVALRSSNNVDIIGKSFCLLSSLDIKPLSSCNTRGENTIRTTAKMPEKANMTFRWQNCAVPPEL